MKVFPFTEEVVLRVIGETGLKVRPHTNYTGRGMQGVLADRTCVGFIVPDENTITSFLLWLGGETEAEGVDLEDLVEAARNMRKDNLGNDLIAYFPSYAEFAEPTRDDDTGNEDEARLIALRGMN